MPIIIAFALIPAKYFDIDEAVKAARNRSRKSRSQQINQGVAGCTGGNEFRIKQDDNAFDHLGFSGDVFKKGRSSEH